MKFFEALFNLIFPEKYNCFICGGKASYGLCRGCADSLPKINGKTCKICGKKVSDEEELCINCKSNKIYFDGCAVPFVYREKVEKLIHLFKYQNQKVLAKPMAELMVWEIFKKGWKVDVVTFIPLHPERLMERGYNQSELLAIYIGEFMGIDVLPLLKRVKNTGSQTLLRAGERHENIRNAFKAEESFEKKSILLVDDILTTGATLNEASRILKENGASFVYAAVFASGFIEKMY